MPPENCPYAEMGQKCSFLCVLCSLRHECIYCGFKERQNHGSNCYSPFRDPFETPTNMPAPQLGGINNDQECFSGASDKEVGQIRPCGTSAVQLEGIGQENGGKYAASNDIRSKEMLPQLKLAYWSENSNQGPGESPLEVNEYDEDEIDSQAETDPLAGYACVLCDEPDDTEDMVGCELDTGWFHLSCVGLTNFPVGKWYCHYCVGDQSQHAKGRAAPPQSSPADQTGPRPQSEERATSAIITPFEKSKSTFSNLSQVESAPKKQTLCPKGPKSAVHNLTRSQNVPRKENWKDDEKNYVIALMQEVVKEGETTERKWAIVSSRLMSRYAVDRSVGSVKNWWNRHGRAMSNIDERIVPKPYKLKTGRRKGHQSSKREAEDVDGDHIDSGSESRKRQKSTISQLSKAESIDPAMRAEKLL